MVVKKNEEAFCITTQKRYLEYTEKNQGASSYLFFKEGNENVCICLHLHISGKNKG
jgi:hypothetical protein